MRTLLLVVVGALLGASLSAIAGSQPGSARFFVAGKDAASADVSALQLHPNLAACAVAGSPQSIADSLSIFKRAGLKSHTIVSDAPASYVVCSW